MRVHRFELTMCLGREGSPPAFGQITNPDDLWNYSCQEPYVHAASAATRAHTPRWHDRRATQSPCAAHAGARVALAAATDIDRKEAAASVVMSGAAHSCDHEQSFHSEEKET